MTTRPLNMNWSRNQNKSRDGGIRGAEPSRKRKFTLATTQAAIKNTERVAILRRISVRTLVSGRSSAIGQDARKSSLAQTSSPDTTALTRAKNVTCVPFAPSASWEAIIFRSTPKRMDWSREKNSTDPRTLCSFEAERFGCARLGALERRARDYNCVRCWPQLSWRLIIVSTESAGGSDIETVGDIFF